MCKKFCDIMDLESIRYLLNVQQPRLLLTPSLNSSQDHNQIHRFEKQLCVLRYDECAEQVKRRVLDCLVELVASQGR